MAKKRGDRRVERTKRALRDALVELMLIKSYDKITIQELIDRADVGRATFYNHYDDKDDLLLRGVAEIAGDEHAPPSDAEAAQGLRTAAMFAHSRRNDQIHKVMFRRRRDNPILLNVSAFLYDRVSERLQQLAQSGDTPATSLPVAATFISGGLLALIDWWHQNDFPYSEEEMDRFVQQLIGGSYTE